MKRHLFYSVSWALGMASPGGLWAASFIVQGGLGREWRTLISSLAVCTMCVCVAFGRVGMVCCSGGVWIQREDAWTNLC